MSKKFMIVKPTPCCKNPDGIGEVGILLHQDFDDLHMMQCCFCGEVTSQKNNPAIFVQDDDSCGLIDKCRVIFLPDESDVIDHDMREELAA